MRCPRESNRKPVVSVVNRASGDRRALLNLFERHVGAKSRGLDGLSILARLVSRPRNERHARIINVGAVESYVNARVS
jgi:hypothetical protein